MRDSAHKVTEKRQARVVRMRGKGYLRTKIAKKLRIKIATLKELYADELVEGNKIWSKAKKRNPNAAPPRQLKRDPSDFVSYKYGQEPPPNCRLSEAQIAKLSGRIVKWDENGNPCDRNGHSLVGKRMLEAATGATALREDPAWGSLLSRDEAYHATSIGKKPWNLSFPEWDKALIARKSLIPPSIPVSLVDLHLTALPAKVKRSDTFNVDLAQRAVIAFNNLRLADVEGTPAMSEAGADWFREIVAVIFGSYDPATKSRMIREIFVLVPKKNNKTTGGALIMLLLLIFNERPNGQAVMTAPENRVAKIAFDAIHGAISLDPVLDQAFMVKPHRRSIIDRHTGAQLSVITFSPKALTGQKVFAALIDEVHVMMKIKYADRAIQQIRGGMLPFPEAILILITTQSEDAPIGVFASELNAARDVRDGKFTESKKLPILYEFPDYMQKSADKAWRDPKMWPMVTPNAGKSIGLADLETAFNEASNKGEAALRSWGSQHLNIEIGVALRSDSWPGAEFWEIGYYEKAATLDSLLASCEVVCIGIDGGGLADLLSLAVTGREHGTQRWLTWTMSWLSRAAATRRAAEAQTIEEFDRLGELRLVEEMGEDVAELVEIIDKCEKAGLLDKIGADPYGVGSIIDEILAIGITPDRIVGISQGWRLGGAIKSAERALMEGKLVHGGQKIMAWAVANAKVEPRGNASFVTKQASGNGKIDPLMAMFDSIHLIAANPQAKSKKFQMLVFGKGSGNNVRSMPR